MAIIRKRTNEDKELKALDSKKFNNKLFFIDSGIPNSTEEFAEGIVKGNTPRIAMAQPFDIFIKNNNIKEEKSKKQFDKNITF